MKLTLSQSSLVMRFVNNDFQENKEPTIGGMQCLARNRVSLLRHIHTFARAILTHSDSRIPHTEMQPAVPNHQV